jgi:hypothetical protein
MGKSVNYSIFENHKPGFMKKLFFAFGMFLAVAGSYAQGSTKNLYFESDSFRLSKDNIALLEKSFAETPPGGRITYRILIHEDAKNKGAINELDRKRSLELYDFFIAEGISPNSLKSIKTPGREAKGFISDEMKNLLIYDLEVYKTNPAVEFTTATDLPMPDGPLQIFELEVASGKTLQTKGGLQILIPAYALVLKNGLAPAGRISIQIREYLHPGEMASAGLNTQLNESPLQAAYIIWIAAETSGQPLRLQKGSTITITGPKPQGDFANPELFAGQVEAGVFNLVQANPPLPARSENTSLVLLCSHLKWIVCAAPLKTATADLTVKAPTKMNLAIRLVLEKDKMVCAAYALPGGKETGFTHLPAGQKATLIAYGLKDGKVYFYSKALQISPGAKEKIQLKESSISEITAFLAGLDKE